MTGRVIKGIGGFYFVHDGQTAVMGKARGNLKRNKELICVGDIVDFDIDENDSDNECVINKVLIRRNQLTRPPVSNLDILVVVFSIKHPAVNLPVVDKLIAGAELNGIRPVICISKKDLVSESVLKSFAEIYEGVYPVVAVNGNTGEGIEDLMQILRGHSVALAGSSGVGKSTIINNIIGDKAAETGDISDKTRRGRHTTRHVEIFPLGDDTYIYDTPGFTSLDMPVTEPVKIRELFPEFREFNQSCRYSDCMHLSEPECKVKEALADGKIHPKRYDSYVMLTEEVKKCQK